ncbi:MAG: DUF4388 domain-containing protein [Actinomycetota bacterium]
MIRGTLDDFSLPEIIRLIATGARSGILEVKGATGSGRIVFDAGAVRSAESNYAREPIGRKLIRLSAVSEEDVWSVLERGGGERRRLGEALIEAGLVDEARVASALAEQVEEDVLNLLRQNPVEFVWVPGAVPAAGPAIPAGQLIAAVTRRLAEFRNLRSRIPSDEALIALAPSPSGSEHEIRLTPNQWRLLALLSGRRVVRDVLRYSGAGDIQTLRVLGGLIAEGLIEVKEPDPDSHAPPSWEGNLDRVWPPPPPPEEASSSHRRPNEPRVIRLPDEGAVLPPSHASFEIALVGAGNRLYGPLAAAWLHQLLAGSSIRVKSLGVQDLASIPPPVEVIEAARRWGVEVAGHRTEQLRAGSLRGADLVLGWDRFDVDTSVALGGAARERAFTLGEFADLIGGVRAPEGSDVGSRARLLTARANRARAEGGEDAIRPEGSGPAAAGRTPAPPGGAGSHDGNGGRRESVAARIRALCVIVGEAMVDPDAHLRLGPPPPPPAASGIRPS